MLLLTISHSISLYRTTTKQRREEIISEKNKIYISEVKPEKNCTPCWGYRFFWSGFCIDPLEIHVFPQFLVYPLGIPWIFHWYPQQGGYNVFWKSPIFKSKYKINFLPGLVRHRANILRSHEADKFAMDVVSMKNKMEAKSFTLFHTIFFKQKRSHQAQFLAASTS